MNEMKAPERAAPAFFDEETQRFLSFSEIISHYRPLSVFGKKAFSNLTNISPTELERHFGFLAEVRKCEDLRARLEHTLEDFHEISESLRLIGINRATQVDLFEIKRFIHHQRILRGLVERCGLDLFGDFQEMWDLLDPQGSASYAFSPQNTEIGRLSGECGVLQSKLSSMYRKRFETIGERFGIFPKDRRFVTDRKSASEMIDSDLVMVEREGLRSYTLVVRPTEEIIDLESKLTDLEDDLHEAQNKEISRLSGILANRLDLFREEINGIAGFDLALAQLRAINEGWTFPKFDSAIDLEDAFHPIVSEAVKNDGFEYTKLNGRFDEGLTMVFGPNMGGKTSVLKTIGIVCSLAMHGFPVPARYSVLPFIDWVRYIGVTSGTVSLSSFAAQMDSMANSMNLGGRGLILVDEFGSGTNPYEGEALAAALGFILSKSKNFSVIVTHFRKAIETVDCKKYTVGRLDLAGEVTAQTVRSKIDHSLVDGSQITTGDAIKLARVLGLPKEVTDLAEELLKDR